MTDNPSRAAPQRVVESFYKEIRNILESIISHIKGVVLKGGYECMSILPGCYVRVIHVLSFRKHNNE
jgi:hypothetical protein